MRTRDIVLTWPGLFILAVVVILAIILQASFSEWRKGKSVVVQSVECLGTKLAPHDDGLRLELNCNGVEAFTPEQEAVIKYSKDPKVSFTCTTYKSGKAICPLVEKE
jgi:hypothetical protein